MVAVLIFAEKLDAARGGCDVNSRGRSWAFDRMARLVRGAFRLKLILELVDKTEHRPGAGLAEGANGPALYVFGDVEEIIRVLPAALAVREPAQGLAHPEGAFATGRALSTAFVRVKLRDVGQRLDHVRRIVHDNDGARAAHAARL